MIHVIADSNDWQEISEVEAVALVAAGIIEECVMHDEGGTYHFAAEKCWGDVRAALAPGRRADGREVGRAGCLKARPLVRGHGDRELRWSDVKDANTYVGSDDRFVVSLLVGYKPEDGDVDEDGPIDTPEKAARWAIGMTTDDACGDTHWYVRDRLTGVTSMFEQREFDPDFDEYRDSAHTG